MLSSRKKIIELEFFLTSFKCVVAKNSAIYLSGPITTGKLFLEWYRIEGESLYANSKQYQSSLRKNVITPNELRIQLFVKQLRSKFPLVIEPSSLRVSNWSQDEYNHFWTLVIKEFTKEVVLLNEWEFSVGCISEYCAAMEKRIPTLNENLSEIGLDEGISLIESALDNYKTANLEMEKIVISLNKIKSISTSPL